mmetsp:Transcript_1730/g.5024  ORF Transcript_1730/g.5024 Transcript_1730/m.5024 type:complete len:213 (-) Transcript_1730:1142-1780(-)
MALNLTGAEKYNPNKMEELQKHVAAQVANGSYDRDANLALLRLYNFEPEMVDGQTLANVLLLALMRLPEVDFSLLLHLIPNSSQDLPLINAVISLDRKLESFQFMQFWQEADQLREILNPIVGFYDAVRRYILHSLLNTFQQLPKTQLSQSLKADGATLDDLISQKIASDGWMITADNVIRFPKKKKQVSQQQTASTRSQFDKLVPVLKLAA